MEGSLVVSLSCLQGKKNHRVEKGRTRPKKHFWNREQDTKGQEWAKIEAN